MRSTLIERFADKWRRDLVTGCWMWQAATFGDNGYGCINVAGKTTAAHRLAWTFRNGAIPEGLFVLHRCDTPRCVNPDHMFLGTIQDNVRDMHAKGRRVNPRGERCHAAKLSDATVAQMLTRVRSGELSQGRAAKIYGCSQQHISKLVRGERRVSAT